MAYFVTTVMNDCFPYRAKERGKGFKMAKLHNFLLSNNIGHLSLQNIILPSNYI
jgi:hypothetical protein